MGMLQRESNAKGDVNESQTLRDPLLAVSHNTSHPFFKSSPFVSDTGIFILEGRKNVSRHNGFPGLK